jgi:dienelactone hydrolase
VFHILKYEKSNGRMRQIIITVIVVAGLLLSGACTTAVKFKSNAQSDLTLRGYSIKPDGDGRFPAVVMLHGCGGIRDFHLQWASRLKEWGYVSLRVDSFSPRNISNICANGESEDVSPYHRALDAHGAKLYLSELPFVDQRRIAVMGWSQGGRSVLWAAMRHDYLPNDIGEPFRAAIAFYPWCRNIPPKFGSPLLILIGEKDDWTPASLCESLQEYVKSELTLIIYPEAYHSFDANYSLQYYMGHWIGNNGEASADAQKQAKNSLTNTLNSRSKQLSCIFKIRENEVILLLNLQYPLYSCRYVE